MISRFALAGLIASTAAYAQSNVEIQTLQGVNSLRTTVQAQQTALANRQNNVNVWQTSVNAMRTTQISEGTLLSNLQSSLASLQASVSTLQSAVNRLEPRKRFYLSNGYANGSEARSACAPGFHMASLQEIFNPSDLKYDTTRGASMEDSGAGLPELSGWVRTSNYSSAADNAGTANCFAWTSADPSAHGTRIVWSLDWSDNPNSVIDPWIAFSTTCNNDDRVWCKED